MWPGLVAVDSPLGNAKFPSVKTWSYVLLVLVCACPGKPVPAPVDAALPDARRFAADGVPDADSRGDARALVPAIIASAQPVRRKAFEVWLRSTPPGALAAVDGRPVGQTPVKASVVLDKRAHDFTFTLSGYAMTRYKVRVLKSGVVHGMLRPLPVEADAGP